MFFEGWSYKRKKKGEVGRDEKEIEQPGQNPAHTRHAGNACSRLAHCATLVPLVILYPSFYLNELRHQRKGKLPKDVANRSKTIVEV